jgi:hypothetical protein
VESENCLFSRFWTFYGKKQELREKIRLSRAVAGAGVTQYLSNAYSLPEIEN